MRIRYLDVQEKEERGDRVLLNGWKVEAVCRGIAIPKARQVGSLEHDRRG